MRVHINQENIRANLHLLVMISLKLALQVTLQIMENQVKQVLSKNKVSLVRSQARQVLVLNMRVHINLLMNQNINLLNQLINQVAQVLAPNKASIVLVRSH